MTKLESSRTAGKQTTQWTRGLRQELARVTTYVLLLNMIHESRILAKYPYLNYIGKSKYIIYIIYFLLNMFLVHLYKYRYLLI